MSQRNVLSPGVVAQRLNGLVEPATWQRLARLSHPRDVGGIRRLPSGDDPRVIRDQIRGVEVWHAFRRIAQPDLIAENQRWLAPLVEAVGKASALPPYHYWSGEKRRATRRRIEKRVVALEKALKSIELSLLSFEFPPSTRRDAARSTAMVGSRWDEGTLMVSPPPEHGGTVQIPVAWVMHRLVEQSGRWLSEPVKGKVVADVYAIRFVRALAPHNRNWFGGSLPDALAEFAHALYGVAYRASDVDELLAYYPESGLTAG